MRSLLLSLALGAASLFGLLAISPSHAEAQLFRRGWMRPYYSGYYYPSYSSYYSWYRYPTYSYYWGGYPTYSYSYYWPYTTGYFTPAYSTYYTPGYYGYYWGY
jgi:hypothetical protein